MYRRRRRGSGEPTAVFNKGPPSFIQLPVSPSPNPALHPRLFEIIVVQLATHTIE